VAPTEALEALAQLLPDMPARERALAIGAAAVMVNGPLEDSPAVELIGRLIRQLNADPKRVAVLAAELTAWAAPGAVVPNATRQSALPA
jgi:hypothetical protein